MSLRIQVSDLIARPGSSRREAGTLDVEVDLTTASVHGPIDVVADIRSLSDGVIARGRVSARANLVCNRCLSEHVGDVSCDFEQVYRLVPEDPETELQVENGAWIDLEPTCRDELVLSLPQVSLCNVDCRGLCPTCGTDLNTGSCSGHAEGLSSPFAALARLFESPTD